MTDKEKWIEFLKEFEIGYTDEGDIISITSGMKNVDGYVGFCCNIEFDGNDDFEGLGIWEY